MHNFRSELERFFASLDRLQLNLSNRWRMHVNRRTFLILVFIGALISVGYLYAIRPPHNFPTGELVTIPAGESLGEVAQTLKSNGVIRSTLAFRAIAILL